MSVFADIVVIQDFQISRLFLVKHIWTTSFSGLVAPVLAVFIIYCSLDFSFLLKQRLSLLQHCMSFL